MAIEIVSAVLNNSKATGRAKLVLIGIANHQGDQGAWPSKATLARYANASERSVQRDIQTLIELGELRVEVNASPGDSQYKTNRYWVLVSGETDWVNNPSGETTQVIRGDSSGKSGETTGGSQNVNLTVKEPLEGKNRKTFDKDWILPDDQRTKLEALYPNADLDRELGLMIDYLLAEGKEKSVKDMAAKFRTWMANADKFNKGSYSKRVMDEWFVKPENRIQR
jgi:hypothetical protein